MNKELKELKEKVNNIEVKNELEEALLILKYIKKLEEEIEKLSNENFKLDYQNTRIKGALFEFEINYYQDNLKGNNVE